MHRKALETLVVLSLLVSPAVADDALQLKSQADRMNYALGVNVIKSAKQQGVEIDLDMMIRGMRDARSGGTLLMSDEEFRRTMHGIQDEVRRRQKLAPIIAAKEGQTFLAENKTKKGVVTLPTGLQYEILKEGSGRKPTDADLVLCDYRGTLLNGAEFDRSYPGRPVTFSVREGGGIPGVSEALKLMPVNSKWRLFIPPGLAYGERGRTSIIGSPVGPNETIIVELELLAIK